jgi:hypothetical protein
MAFLKSLVLLVAVTLNDKTIVENISPADIACGLEPEKTNILIRSLVVAACDFGHR